MLSIHVISNGDLFREVFNGIAVLVGEKSFDTAMRISVIFAVIGVAVQYIKTKDLRAFVTWFMIYFAVVNIMLLPKQSVEIIDSSNPGAVYQVDNVPFGLAYPASLITSISFALEELMETVFSAPDDATYSKTGFLFGSQLFKLSTGFGIIDPEVKEHFNDYMKSCVIGDILINQKYSLQQLINSQDIWSLISQNPSPIRGIYLNGEFKTCREATPMVKTALANDISNNALAFYGKRIFGQNDETTAKNLLSQYLVSSTNYYTGLSQSASDILMQNVAVNAIKNGIRNYSASTGATAALLNLSTTKSMEQMRMSWATSKNMAAYTLPLMQTVMLLMLLCMFPIIVLLSIQPVFGVMALKNFIYSLLWVESWPFLYSAFNMAASYYLHVKTGSLASGGLTLSNANALALEHSDVANMAGYMTTCIPFIAMGIVYGMARSFSSAANYIGGMMHGAASSSAAEAVSGNLSYGNTSLNNVSANKHDTSFSNMHGMHTEQLANGGIITYAPDGHPIYNTNSAMSQLPISVHVGSSLSQSFGHSAEASRQAALHDANQFSESVSSAAAQLESYGSSKGLQYSQNDNYSVNKNTTEDQALSNLYSLAMEYSARNGVSFNDALSNLTSASVGLKGNLGWHVPIAAKLFGAKGGVDVTASGNWQRDHKSSTSNEHNYALADSNRLERQFRDNLTVAMSYGHNEQTSTNYSNGSTASSQISSELRSAMNSAKTWTSDLTQSERYSSMANYASSQSASLDQNFAPGFADYVHHVDRARAESLLTNVNSPSIASLREQYAQSYLNQYQEKFEQQFDSFGQNTNPDQKFQQDSLRIQAMQSGVQQQYSSHAAAIGAAGAGMADGRSIDQSVMKDTRNHQANADVSMAEKGGVMGKQERDEAKIRERVTHGAQQADTGVVASLMNIDNGDFNQTGIENDNT